MRKPVVAALAEFARGEIDLEELEEALAGFVRFRYADTDERSVEFLKGPLPAVRFRKDDVERLLRRYLRGELTPREASDWAATLRLLDCFEHTASEPDTDAVWDVLDRLSSPDAWGALTTETALELMQQL